MYRSMNGQMDTWLQTDGQMAINDHPSKKTEDLDDIDQLIASSIMVTLIYLESLALDIIVRCTKVWCSALSL